MTAVADDVDTRPGQMSPWVAVPPMAFLLIIGLLPVVITVIYSFLDRATVGVGVVYKFNPTAYKHLFFQEQLSGETTFDAQFVKVIWNSFKYSAITTVVTVFLSIPVAMWIATRAESVRNLLVAIVTLPFWISILIRTYGLGKIIADNGPIGWVFDKLGINFHIMYTPTATMIGLVYVFLPFMILPIYASAERFDFRLAEAGYDLGAKKFTVLRKVVLPAIRPGIISGIALVFIPALGSFLQSDMLGGGKTNMIANVIALQFGQARNWPLGCALSVLLILFTLIFVLAVQKIAAIRGDKVELV